MRKYEGKGNDLWEKKKKKNKASPETPDEAYSERRKNKKKGDKYE